MRAPMLLAVVLAALVGAASSAQADSVSFSKGALIIPMNSRFQTECGMVSAYGLVYRILEANAPGHLNENTPVTVYIVNNETKKSPNRCIPSNKSSFQAGVGNQSSSAWSDGCDFTIVNSTAGQQPVVPVDFSQASYPGIFANGPLMTFDDPDAWPRYTPSASLGVSTASTTKLDAADGFTTINYSGAPFVIDAPDVPAVFNLLTNPNGDNGIIPREALQYFTCNNASPSGETTTCACTGMGATGADNKGNYTLNSVTVAGKTLHVSSGVHAVMMHQATIDFGPVNVSKRLFSPPPTFALSEGTAANILESYIEESGLWLDGTAQLSGAAQYQDSEGCPVGNISGGCNFNGSTPGTTTTPAPASAVHSGVVFDDYQLDDLAYTSATYPNGTINPDVSAKGGYSLFWSPHWQMGKGPYSGSRSDANSLANVKAFWNRKNVAIMTECHSIIGYENAESGYGGTAAGTNFLFKSGFRNSNTVSGKNCSDPDHVAGADCATYPNAGNLFAQVGDWSYNNISGSMPGMGPTVADGYGGYQTGTSVMVTTSNGQDAFDLGQRDSKHAIVVYVAGHVVSGDPQGSRIVLNSLLNLYSVPVSQERGIAAPVVAYARGDSNTKYGDEILTPEYDQLSGLSTNPAVITFDPNQSQLWMYPYYQGEFRAQDATQLTAKGEFNFDKFSLWDANQLASPDGMGTGAGTPPPASRNLFTYFGGYPAANPTLPGGGKAPNGVLQWNWYPESVDGTLLSGACTALGSVTSGCVDQMAFQQLLTSAPTYDDGESSGKGASLAVAPDGICDLQESMAYTGLNSGADWGGDCNANNIKKFLKDEPNVAEILQRVRGYCSDGVLSGLVADLNPGDALCIDPSLSNIENDNRAHLGGLVHSSPAVVTVSPNIPDLGAGRPTVAYAGGYDGELHAFYVGGGSGYKGPDTSANSVNFAWHIGANDDDPAVNNKFNTKWGGTSTTAFVPPAVGTELWAFLPASQLPHLQDNSAQVDGSPTVQDVFADFGGTGLREWHTVLIDSVGTAGNELFALDVTNPLHPRLLWDLVGGLFGTPQYSPTMLLDDSMTVGTGYPSCNPTGHTSPMPGKCVSPKWIHGTTHYVSAPGTDVAGGRIDTKVYDYQSLGGSRHVSLAELRVGLEPFYVAYVTSFVSTSKGKSGIEVFAIDATTGQKLWQWEKLYTDAGKSSNALVAPPTVMYGKDGASRVLVGDLEGQLWELDALTGKNVNFTTNSQLGCSAAAPCEFPAFDTQSTDALNQPITTNIAVAQIPTNIAAGLALSNYAGATVLLFGTAGADWVNSPGSDTGKLHVVLYDQQRVPIFSVTGNQLDGKSAWTNATALAAANKSGVLQEVPGFPTIFAAGERLYGDITVSGASAVFATAKGSIGNDIMKVNASTAGKTYQLDLSAVAVGGSPSYVGGTKATYGGVAVYAPAGVAKAFVGDEIDKLNVITAPTGNVAPNSSLNPSKKSWTYRLRNWLLRFMK